MRLLSAQITGYRLFGRTIEVSFQPGLNCVLGPDGCGKTSLIEALQWAIGDSGFSDSPDDLLFRGAESKPRAKGMLVEFKFTEALCQKTDIVISRFMARDLRLSEYRIDDEPQGDVFPPHYAGLIEEMCWITDNSNLEAMAMDPPSGKILVFDDLDRGLSEEEFSRHYDAVSRLRETNQIILTSHRKDMMRLAGNMIGVTMEEYGISKTIEMRFTSDGN
jgi:chromosome segregation ATPase